jgi:hypothetical protein
LLLVVVAQVATMVQVHQVLQIHLVLVLVAIEQQQDLQLQQVLH